MISEDYVSLEIAKLLKEKGFKVWCRHCYGLDVRHNGKPIDVDEEYELKDAGRENEIEYVDGGRMYDYGCGNFNPGSPYAAPSLYVAMKWLREVHHIAISVYVFNRDVPLKEDNIIYTCDIATANMSSKEGHLRLVGPYEEAAEAAIKYCLENLI